MKKIQKYDTSHLILTNQVLSPIYKAQSKDRKAINTVKSHGSVAATLKAGATKAKSWIKRMIDEHVGHILIMIYVLMTAFFVFNATSGTALDVDGP